MKKPGNPEGYIVTGYGVPGRHNCDAWIISRVTNWGRGRGIAVLAWFGATRIYTWETAPRGAVTWWRCGRRWLLRRVPAGYEYAGRQVPKRQNCDAWLAGATCDQVHTWADFPCGSRGFFRHLLKKISEGAKNP